MTIMIIEDSKPMRNLIKRTLTQAGFGDHEVIEAGDGEAGLSLIKSSKPDLVLCDWNMPKMNGMELKKEEDEVMNILHVTHNIGINYSKFCLDMLNKVVKHTKEFSMVESNIHESWLEIKLKKS